MELTFEKEPDKINFQMYEKDDKKLQLIPNIVQDDVEAKIFDANFVTTHFTHYSDEI